MKLATRLYNPIQRMALVLIGLDHACISLDFGFHFLCVHIVCKQLVPFSAGTAVAYVIVERWPVGKPSKACQAIPATHLLPHRAPDAMLAPFVINKLMLGRHVLGAYVAGMSL